VCGGERSSIGRRLRLRGSAAILDVLLGGMFSSAPLAAEGPAGAGPGAAPLRANALSETDFYGYTENAMSWVIPWKIQTVDILKRWALR
jgi:hypothetical protein